MDLFAQSYADIFSNFVLLGIVIVAIMVVAVIVVLALLGLRHVKDNDPEKDMEPETAAEAAKPDENAGSQHE